MPLRLFPEKERRKGKKREEDSPFFSFFSCPLVLSCHEKSLLSRSLLRSDYWVRLIWLFCQKECSAFYAVYSSSNALNSSIFCDIFNNSISYFQQITSYVGLILPPQKKKISSGLSKPSTTEMRHNTLTFRIQKIISYVNIADIIQNYFRID